MPDTIIARPVGRVSEPSYMVAPKGSLLKAENCVLREPGILSPVPSLSILTDSGGPLNQGARQISPVFRNGTDARQLCHVTNGNTTDGGVRKSSDMGTEIQYNDYDGAASSIRAYRHGWGLSTFYPMHLQRDNLYLADQRGCYKWLSTDDTDLETVWDVPISFVVDSGNLYSGTNNWLSNNSHVRYRVVAKLRDANGVVRLGTPSPAYRIENTSGSSKAVVVDVVVPTHIYSNVSLESVLVYRSRTFANTTAIPREYYLVSEVPYASLSVTTDGDAYDHGFNDEVSDSDLGEALYTNTSREGELAANIAPPEHIYQASFSGHVFWANVAEKEYSQEFKLTATTASTEHTPTLSGTTSIGSPTFTATALNGIEVGMLSTDGTFPSGSYITSITGAGPYTVTVSQNAASSTSTPDFGDTVYVLWGDGETARFPLVHLPGATNYRTSHEDDAYLDVRVYGGSELGYNSQYTLVFTVSSPHRPARQGSAQVWVSNPANFEGTSFADLDTGSGAPTTGGTEVPQAVHRSRVYWSKYQEPEVTTITSFQDIGNAVGIGGGDIVGLAALREALIILKRDSIFRLTGSLGNWRIEELDVGTGIIGGRSTAVMDNAVYTLGDRGLLRITSGSVESLSDGVVNDWFRESDIGDARIEDVREYMQDNGGYHPEGLFAAADLAHREYVLACEGPDSPGDVGAVREFLVYNAKTGAFTTWALHESFAFEFAGLSYAEGDYYTTGNDQTPGIVVARKVSSGDTSAALFLVDNRQATKEGVYSTYDQDIRFRTLHEGDPTHIKHWSELVWDTDGNGPPSGTVTAVFQDGEGGADVTQSVDTSDDDEEIRIWPPLDVARSTKLIAGLQGVGLTIYALRATYTSSGRTSPL